ncbi:MAG: protease inhibitor I9 family protein [Bacillota bacterium]
MRNRSHRLRRWAAALTLTGLLFSVAMPGAGAAPEAKQRIKLEGLSLQQQKVILMVELPSAPLVAMQSGPQGVKQSEILKAEHAQLKQGLAKERIDHRVLSSHTKLFNGIAMEVRATDVARVAALPGVKSVQVDRPHALPEPQLASSVEMINALQVQTGAPGQPGIDGTGVTVAVIDTGLSVGHRT